VSEAGPGWFRGTAEGGRVLCSYALAVGAMLLAGYALFLVAGPAVAAPFLTVAIPAAVAIFAVLLSRRPLLLVVFGGICALVTAVSVFSLIVEWDARSIWFYHARFIVDGAGPRELLGPDRPLSHPQYPKMLPLVAATVARAAGFWNEALPKLAIPILLSVPLAYMLGAWRGRTARLLVLAATFIICGRFLWNGYVDGILAIYAVAALGAGLRCLDGGQRLDGNCFAVLMSLLPTLKTEGLLAWGAVAVALAARTLATGEWRAAGRAVRLSAAPVAAGLVVALGWFAYVHVLSAQYADVFTGDPIERILRRLGDGESLWQIWRAMFVRDYQVVWLAAALGLFAFGRPEVRRSVGPFLAAAVVVFAGLTAVYLLTHADLAWHLQTSADRTTMTAVLLLAVGLVPFRRPGGYAAAS
jgi:hypothetical protein